MNNPASRLSYLAALISKNTEVFEAYLRENNIPDPSFEINAPLLDGPFPPRIEAARIDIQDATLELRELTIGPRIGLVVACNSGRADIDTIYRYRIAHLIPVDDPQGTAYEALSEHTGLPVPTLQRIIRCAIVNRIFSEPSPGRVAHSAASRLIVTDTVMESTVGFAVQEANPAIRFLGRALAKFPTADEPMHSAASLLEIACEKVTNIKEDDKELMTHWDILAKHPDRAARFAQNMTAWQKRPANAVEHVINAFDWGSLPEGSVVVDVGGSHGEVDIAIARRFAHTKHVVQDLEATIESAPALPEDVAGRIKLEVHDFFTEQPVKGASVYLLKWILHDWTDNYAIKILRCLIPALVNASRVLIMDAVLPALGTVPNTVERDARFMDLAMMALYNAGDRESSQWEALVRQADPRFVWHGVRYIEGSALSMMEVGWAD